MPELITTASRGLPPTPSAGGSARANSSKASDTYNVSTHMRVSDCSFTEKRPTLSSTSSPVSPREALVCRLHLCCLLVSGVFAFLREDLRFLGRAPSGTGEDALILKQHHHDNMACMAYPSRKVCFTILLYRSTGISIYKRHCRYKMKGLAKVDNLRYRMFSSREALS